MKSKKAEKINLPYASTVASFFGDQGATSGSSFLGRLFKGGERSQMTQTQPGNVRSGVGAGIAALMPNLSGGGRK